MSAVQPRWSVRVAGRLLILVVWGAFVWLVFTVGRRVVPLWPAWAEYTKTARVSRDAADEGLLMNHPTLGWTARPSATWTIPPVEGEHAGGSWAFNAQGVRSDRPTPAERAPNTVRIVALGDSFTLGTGPLEDTWTQQLQGALPHSEILNLGVPEYDVGQLLLRWEADGVPLQPEIVVVSVIEPMQRRARAARANSGRARPLFQIDEADALRWPQPPLPAPLPRGRSLDGPLGFVRFAATGVVQGIWNQGAVEPELPSRVLAVLGERIRAAHAQPVFVYLPMQGSSTASGQAIVEAAAAATQAPFVDLTPVFLAAEDGEPVDGPWFLPDMHYNRVGNRTVADTLAPVLRRLDPRFASPESDPP